VEVSPLRRLQRVFPSDTSSAGVLVACCELRARVLLSALRGRYDRRRSYIRPNALIAHCCQNWEIPGENLLVQNFPDVPLSKVLRLEGLANRDSMHYTEPYSLKDSELRTMLRGTLRWMCPAPATKLSIDNSSRYPGFASLMHSFGAIGLLESSKPIHLDHWSSLTRLALEQKLGDSIPKDDLPSLKSALASVLPSTSIPPLLEALNWLHLLPIARGSSPAFGPLLPVPGHALPPADALALHLAHSLRYAQHERDLVLLHHEIVARDHSGAEQVHTSTLIAYGNAQASAMARTVGLPVAFAALRVLDGSVDATGVWGPTAEEAVWRGVLEGLDSKGFGVKESIRSGPSMEGVLAAGLQWTTALV
jgi:alpha-aminoadipic semialdehyde synthase